MPCIYISKMKKIIIIIFFSLLLLSGCKKDIEKIDNEKEQELNYQTLKDYDFDVNKYEIEEIPFVFVEKLSRLDNYTKTTKGNTIAKKIITYNQEIDNTYIQNSTEKHLITISKSSLKNLYHEAYFKEDIISLKTKENDEFSDISYDEYQLTYGYLPYGYHLEGFVLSKESIKEITKVDTNQYHLVLDNEIGTNDVKIQMKEFGALNDYPSFSLIEIDIVIEEDFTPIKIILKSEYEVDIKILGKTKCTQDYTVEFKYE